MARQAVWHTQAIYQMGTALDEKKSRGKAMHFLLGIATNAIMNALWALPRTSFDTWTYLMNQSQTGKGLNCGQNSDRVLVKFI